MMNMFGPAGCVLMPLTFVHQIVAIFFALVTYHPQGVGFQELSFMLQVVQITP